MLFDVIHRKKSSAGGIDGWGWKEFKTPLLPWFDGLATFHNKIEDDGVLPEGLFDAYIAMIPESDGDSTLLAQMFLCVLPVVNRLWVSVRLAHLGEWFASWVPRRSFVLVGGGGVVLLRHGILLL